MPRVGSSTISTLGCIDSHLPMTIFCWLPPGQVADLLLPAGRADLQLVAVLVEDRDLRAVGDEWPGGQVTRPAAGSCCPGNSCPAPAPVPCGFPAPARCPARWRRRAMDLHLLAFQQDLPQSGRAGRTGFRRSRCARRRPARKSPPPSPAHLETDILVEIAAAQAAHLQRHVAKLVIAGVAAQVELAADHHLGDRLPRRSRRFRACRGTDRRAER
jgi:hypothetical protein